MTNPSSSTSPQVLNVQWLNALNTKDVVLASSSPRRKEALAHVGVQYRIVPSTFPETLDKSTFGHPSEYAKETARQKALEVYNRLKDEGKTPDLVIAADTVVAHGSRILEKPRSVEGAKEMLASLSGSIHKVYTGVVLVAPPSSPADGPRVLADVEGTEVHMQVFDQELIDAYVATGEPMDKAGGYGYQTTGCVLVKSINGCSWNVIGLPASKLFHMLRNFTSK